MPRKKKVEEVKKEEVKIIEKKPIDYGEGWVRVNNMLQAGFTIDEIMAGVTTNVNMGGKKDV